MLQDVQVDALERAAASLEDWRPEMQGMVDDIRLEVRKLSKHWERMVLNRLPPLLETTPSAAKRPSATSEANRPNGHRDDKFHQEDGYGSVTTIVHPSSRVRYAPPPSTHTPKLPVPPLPSLNNRWKSASNGESRGSRTGRLPK